MEFFWIPEDIKNFISAYFKGTDVIFSDNKYSTNEQKLKIGIMMGYVISPLIFVLVMKMILCSTFIDDGKSSHRIQITHGTTGDPPSNGLQWK